MHEDNPGWSETEGPANKEHMHYEFTMAQFIECLRKLHTRNDVTTFMYIWGPTMGQHLHDKYRNELGSDLAKFLMGLDGQRLSDLTLYFNDQLYGVHFPDQDCEPI